ncbi:ankyrin repeat and SOCS box protein 12 [Anabrus simplex]|uniref:ankyrin repeat and SOCS box protein 12 n=1 Tax=Anabrus simplex TaxID=316456 RepID=UPI0035A34860
MEMHDLIINIVIDPDDGDTTLHLASFLGDTYTIKNILETDDGKKHLNRPVRPFGSSPLRLACSAGKADSVQELLKYGADIDFPDIKMQTPLFVAAHMNHVECCKLVLQAGANPNGNAGNLIPPLHIACSRGFAPIVQLLLQHGAELGGTFAHPLHVAAATGQLCCFILLLLHGTKTDLLELENHEPSLQQVLTKRCEPIFLELWILFGGKVHEHVEAGPLAEVLLRLTKSPLSLQCQCRIQIWRVMRPNVIQRLSKLELPRTLIEFLAYRDIPAVYNCVSKVNSILKTDDLLN